MFSQGLACLHHLFLVLYYVNQEYAHSCFEMFFPGSTAYLLP